MHKNRRSIKRVLYPLIASLLVLTGMLAVNVAAEAAWSKSPPSGLRQVDKTGTSITVGWNATSGANLYYVRATQVANKPSKSQTGTKTTSSSTTTTRNLTGLKPNTWYWIQVRSAKGTTAKHTLLSDYSTGVWIQTPDYSFNSPTGLSVDWVRANSVDLSWNFVNNADSYSIKITGGGQTRYQRVKDTDTLRKVYGTITGLSNNTTYSFQIKGLEQVENPSDNSPENFGRYALTDWSGSVSGTTKTNGEPLQPPANVSKVSATTNSITLKWDKVAGAAQYRVYLSTKISPPSACDKEAYCEVITPSNLNAPQATATGLNPTTTYYALVSARDSSGSTITDYQRFATPMETVSDAPYPVVQVAYASTTAIKMDWPDMAGAVQYDVRYSTDAGMANSKSAGTTNVSEKLVTGLGTNTLYFVQVRMRTVANGPWGGWSVINAAHTRDNFGAIAGNVGESVSGAGSTTVVHVYNSSGAEVGPPVRVSPDGSFTMLGIAPGNGYRVWFQQAGDFNVTSPWAKSGATAGAMYQSQASAYSVSGSAGGTPPVVNVGTTTPPVGKTVSGKVTGSKCFSGTRVTALSDRSSVSKDYVLADTSTASDGTYSLIGLPKGEPYWIRFGSNCGIESVHVDPSTGNDTNVNTTFTSTPIPAYVTGIAASNLTSTSMKLTWDKVTGSSKYRIYYRKSPTMPSACGTDCKIVPATISGDKASYNLTGLTAGAKYWVKISSINDSSGKTITGWQPSGYAVDLPGGTGGATIPTTVQGISGSDVSYEDAQISWDAVPTAVKYRVYASPSSSMPGRCEPNCKVITPSSQTIPSTRLSDVLSSTEVSKRAYYIKISAINASGSTITSWQSAGLKVDLPAATVKFGAVTGATAADATINWTALTGAGSYRVYWSTSSSMPGACEPTCHVVNSTADSIKLSQILTDNAAGGNATPQSLQTYYIKISSISSKTGKTMSGWQSTPLKVTLS